MGPAGGGGGLGGGGVLVGVPPFRGSSLFGPLFTNSLPHSHCLKGNHEGTKYPFLAGSMGDEKRNDPCNYKPSPYGFLEGNPQNRCIPKNPDSVIPYLAHQQVGYKVDLTPVLFMDLMRPFLWPTWMSWLLFLDPIHSIGSELQSILQTPTLNTKYPQRKRLQNKL